MTQVTLDALISGAKNGQLVSFPTDTVPALAVIPENAGLIFAAKGRSQDKPLILMAASSSELWDYVMGTQEELEIWQQVTSSYWPGALTLVLPASERLPKSMNPNNPKSIGIRVPNNTIALEILSQTGPLATTSANLSGQPPLMTIAEIDKQFKDVLTLANTKLEQEVSATGVPSTVAKWTGNNWQILRQGVIQIESHPQQS
jgi:L-threonylcarbamoyladenylate synthase